MSASILAFAAGVVLLQQQAQLPDAALSWALLAGAVLGLCLGVTRRRPFLCVLAACAGGFAYAALRADTRLADALPLDWEARDIVLSGVVVALPQRIERGERFEFAVEAGKLLEVSLEGSVG